MNGEDVDQNFICLICTEVASNAVETLCCGQIMCQQCVNDLLNKNHLNCPNCRQKLAVKTSTLARRIISTIKLSCEGCKEKFAHKDMKTHNRKCPQKVITCKDCQKAVKIKNLIEHMKDEHLQSLVSLCLDYQVGPEQLPSLSKITSAKSCIEMVESRIKNPKGRNCQLGTTNKYYCGQRNLIGKCGCCDGRCGPTNGENCDECMEADVKRFNLEKGYLVNTAGVVCKVNMESGQYYCGRMLSDRTFCSRIGPCQDCKRVTNSVRLGRYKNLL